MTTMADRDRQLAEGLLRAGALLWGLEPDDVINAETAHRNGIADTYRAVAVVLRDNGRWTLERVGMALNRDHSTISATLKRATGLIAAGDSDFLETLAAVEGAHELRTSGSYERPWTLA